MNTIRAIPTNVVEDGIALYTSLVENPLDVLCRGIFADWLEENNCPTYAAMMRRCKPCIIYPKWLWYADGEGWATISNVLLEDVARALKVLPKKMSQPTPLGEVDLWRQWEYTTEIAALLDFYQAIRALCPILPIPDEEPYQEYDNE